MSIRLDVLGAVQVNPAIPVTSVTAAAPSFFAGMNLGLRRTFAEHQEGGLKLSAAVDTPLPFGTVAAAAFLALRVTSGSVLLKITTPAGTDQTVRVSDLLLLSVPTAGDEITGITITGTAEIEYILAGA